MLTAALEPGTPSDEWTVVVPLFASAIALCGVFLTLFVNGRRAERERLRTLYAAGWSAVQAYKEMAFAVRRRNIEDRAAERVRLSEAIRQIQSDLSFHQALIGRERSHSVATDYNALVAETRLIAGGIIRRSWNGDPITSDNQMHSPEIAAELQVLKPFEDGYLSAVAEAVRGRSLLPRRHKRLP
jgi:hypothetical protein